MDAKSVIEKFGGQSALARLIGKGQSTVAYWAKSGVIPAKWHPRLLELARANAVGLTVLDLVPPLGPAVPAGNQTAPGLIPALVPEPQADGSPFLFYSSPDGTVKVQVVVGEESVWASQRGMAEIFAVSVPNINEHLQNIYSTEELDQSTTIRKFRMLVDSGAEQSVNFYSLDAIISVGYRVSSYQATQFRRWATNVLKSYLIKGYVLDDDRLKQGSGMFGKDYFDELLEKIREIRASERRFYQKITDLYAQCSVDYDPHSPMTQQFYAHVQDKLHYAIHGHTSAELIEMRADAAKPNMGLTNWKNPGTGGKVTKLDVIVGKNYLNADELKELDLLVSMYLDWAENFARRHKLMRMNDWIERLDGFLEFNAYNVLQGYGKVSRTAAERHAHAQYEMFRTTQDAGYKSDFDRVVEAAKVRKLPREKAPV